MATPPNIANLDLLKGIIKWMPLGESEYRDLGECLSFTTSIEVETLTYQSRRHSSRIPVKTKTLGKTMTVGLTMSEFATENVEMWTMGESDGGDPEVISIGVAPEIRGALRYIGTNSDSAWQVDLYDVNLSPNGDLEWLADSDWSEMQLQGTVNADPTTGSFGEIQAITPGLEVPAGSPPI